HYMRDHILLSINGKEHRISGALIFQTLSNYLRYNLGATGTKVVCEEGDCGACTVLVRGSQKEEFRAVNSCIQSLSQLDGMSVVTVEGLKQDGELSAVQQSMVTCQGSQCGYCTPGFVMAMSALFEEGQPVDERAVRDGLTGNLCRCTGYEPIIKAALSVDGARVTPLRKTFAEVPAATDAVRIEAGGRVFYAPTTIADAARFKEENAGCTIVQGGTDVGVWVNKRNYQAPAVLSLAGVPGLDELRMEGDSIVAGCRVTLAALERFVRDRVPELYGILNVFGAPQIKNAGTLAGNIANASPIADTLPHLFAADARIELTGVASTRQVPIRSFYLGYKKLDMQPDEIITKVIIPSTGNDLLKLYKVSRRKDLDISAFTAAIRLRITGERLESAVVVYGGVGPVVLRLPRAESFLTGKAPTLETFEEAGRIARGEISPITDVRGSRDYRLQLAENIMSKCWYDLFDQPAGHLALGATA
ncbi:MAG: FAD binding domain-containing protein, partial [Acidobacteriota bacterium]